MRLVDADAYAFPGDLINEPTVDAEPVRHGHWIVKRDCLGEKYIVCSECANVPVHRQESGHLTPVDMSQATYCPACGAKMDLEVSQ